MSGLDEKDVADALAAFNGGLVREASDKNPRGFIDFYRPMVAMEAAISAYLSAVGQKAGTVEAFPQPDRNRSGKPPCAECHLQLGDTCDICGASHPAPSVAEAAEPVTETENQRHWKRAQERLAAQGKTLTPLAQPSPSLVNRIALLGQGACDCNTKSPDVHMHLPTCRYRQAMDLADEAEAVCDLLAEAENFIGNLSGGGETEFRERIRRML